MGQKTNYFRHSLSAHNDTKLIELRCQKGLAAYAAYFILLEVYGRILMDDDDHKLEQKVSIRTLSSATGLRSDSCRSWVRVMAELGLIELIDPTIAQLRPNYNPTIIQLRIPKFLKYFGLYKKAKPMKGHTKIKENKIKEKKNKIPPVPPFNFLDVLNHFNQTCNKNLELTPKRKEIIKAALKRDTIENIKLAITNFSKDTWEDRINFMDLVYAIGTKGKVDNLDKWKNMAEKSNPINEWLKSKEGQL